MGSLSDDDIRNGIRQARRVVLDFPGLGEAEQTRLASAQEEAVDEGVRVARNMDASVRAMAELRGIAIEDAIGDYVLEMMEGMEPGAATFVFDGLPPHVQAFVRAAQHRRGGESTPQP